MSLPISTLTGANTIAQLIYNVNRIKTLAANTASIVANSTFQSALANTNSYIATKVNTTTFNSALANTNSYIATKVNTTTFNSALANTNSYIATKVNTTTFNSALANTNSYIATKYSVANVEAKFVSNTYAQTILANTNSYIATKVNTTTFNSALANTNSYIEIKANTSNPVFIGTARATQGTPYTTYTANTKTLALTDNGYYTRCSNTTLITITIPNNSTVAFPLGSEMIFFQAGSGNVLFANAAGVTLNSKESLINLTGQYSAATLKKISTNTWDLIGDLA